MRASSCLLPGLALLLSLPATALPPGVAAGRVAAPRDLDRDGTLNVFDEDIDGDGIANDREARYDTSPFDYDTDDDGYPDGGELAADSDPTDASSVPGEDYVVIRPGESETLTLAFTLQFSATDVVFLVDATGSMEGALVALAEQFDDIAADLSAGLPDVQYAFATYADYAYDPYGVIGADKPFQVHRQITDDDRGMGAALAEASVHAGGDDPDAGMEALYQVLTGAGYDMGCDGVYDEDYDVKPFIAASGGDPFDGTGGQFYDASDSSTGTIGGAGFRDYALPVIVTMTDTWLRDPDSDADDLNGSPGGCPLDAGSEDVIAEATGFGAQLVGVAVDDTLPVEQMEQLAEGTGSYLDGEPNVLTWTDGDADALRAMIVDAILGIGPSLGYASVSLEPGYDPNGFVTDVSPASVDVDAADWGEDIAFEVRLTADIPAADDDQLYWLDFTFMADGEVTLAQREIAIVVPGAGR